MYFKKGTWTKDTAVLASHSAARLCLSSLRQTGPGAGHLRGPSVIHLILSSLIKRKFVPRCLVLIVMIFEVVV